MRKSTLIATLIAVALSVSAYASDPAVQGAGNAENRQVKNIIFMLSDGTANEAWPLTRWVKGERLASDDILSGAIRTYPTNPVLVVSKGEAKARLPLAKNLVLVNGKTIELEGIVVLAEKLNKVFLPSQAIDVVQAELKE